MPLLHVNRHDLQTIYRVRKKWDDAATQAGAFTNLDAAKTVADKSPGYVVFDDAGKVVYTPAHFNDPTAALQSELAAARSDIANLNKQIEQLAATVEKYKGKIEAARAALV